LTLRVVPVLAIVAIASGLAGLFYPQPSYYRASAASETFTLRINPGPEASSQYITCLWHGACTSTPSAGNALDWFNAASQNQPVLWRSYGYRTINSVDPGLLGLGTILEAHGTCAQVRVLVRDTYMVDRGSSRYTHTLTWTPNWSIGILGDTNWKYTSAQIGFSWADEFHACKNASPEPLWTGQHLHQYADAQQFSSNTSGLNSTSTAYQTESWYNWQHQRSWVWNH
jgi:hypothetical protein